MEQIKFGVEINLNLSPVAEQFLATLSKAMEQHSNCGPIDDETIKPKKPAKPRPTKQKPANVEPETVEPETVEPETAEPETVEPETVEPETVEPETVVVTIDELRRLVGLKVANNREAIKAKLNELGAPSVTKLDPTNYVALYNFLIEL